MDNRPTDESFWRRTPAGSQPTNPNQQAEVRLTDALAKMADVPVASNFTARVMAAIDREDQAQARTSVRTGWNWSRLFPRLAMGMAVVFFAGIGLRHYELTSHRTILAKNVALVATAHPVPSVEALENLDAIQRMGQSAHADGELLADLQ